MIPLSCIAIVYTFSNSLHYTSDYGYKLFIFLFKDSEQWDAVKAWRERESVYVWERERDRETEGGRTGTF